MGGAPGALQGQQVGTQPTHPTPAAGLDWNSIAQWAQQQNQQPPQQQMPGMYGNGAQPYQQAAMAHPATQPFNGPTGQTSNGSWGDQAKQGWYNLQNVPSTQQNFLGGIQQMLAARNR